MKKVVLLGLVFTMIIMIGMLALACGAPASTSTPTSNSAPPSKQVSGQTTVTPKYGGNLKILYWVPVVNIGYPGDADRPDDTRWQQAALESLVRLGKDMQIEPWLATSWEVAPDSKSITFKLRQGVKFHDGTPFNAAAVKTNLDLWKQTRSELQVMTSVDIIDDYTVRVNLSRYEVQVMQYFALKPGAIESPTALKAHDKGWFMTNIVGTGPFKLVSCEPNTKIVFAKNPEYWDKTKPYLDGIEIAIVATQQTEEMAFLAHDGDVLYTSGQYAADVLTKGVENSKLSGPMFFLAPDSANPKSPFADVRVRQAMAYAMDVSAIAKTVGFGTYEAPNQFAYKGQWSYSPNVKGYPYNPEKAKQLIKEAGYPNGFETSLFKTPVSSQASTDAIQGYLKAVGITVNINPITNAKSVQMLVEGWQGGLYNSQINSHSMWDAAYDLAASLTSTCGQLPSIQHFPDVDSLLAQSLTQQDINKRAQLVQQAQELIIDKYCMVIPTYMVWNYAFKNPYVKDLHLIEDPWPFWMPQNAWLDK
jgi:peptide/nickel transport system substrate-binding protein